MRDIDITRFRERLEDAAEVAYALGLGEFRFDYRQYDGRAAKKRIGEGGYGVVYEEPYEINGMQMIQKVSQITVNPVAHYPSKGIVPLDKVIYEDTGEFGQIVFRRLGERPFDFYELNTDVANSNEFHRLQCAVAEYQNLRVLRGQKFVQQVQEDFLYVTGKGAPVMSDREFFLLDGQLCVRTLMSKVPGEDLSMLIKKLQPADVVKIGYDLASALTVLGKEYKIIHRDVSFRNIVYDQVVDGKGNLNIEKSRTYLIDFGNSTREEQGFLRGDLSGDIELLLRKVEKERTSGTLNFMSPELLMNTTVGCTTDYWSLGWVMYELLTGKAPFEAQSKSKQSLVRGILHYSILNQDDLLDELLGLKRYSSDIVEGVVRLVARDPTQRKIEPLLMALEEVLQGRETWKYTPQVSMYTPQNEILPPFRQVTGNVIETEDGLFGMIPAARLGLGKTEEMPRVNQKRVERTSLSFPV